MFYVNRPGHSSSEHDVLMYRAPFGHVLYTVRHAQTVDIHLRGNSPPKRRNYISYL
jgi:hypothetical protein